MKPADHLQKRIFRILDVNYNRAKEALRTFEDINRFVLENKIVTRTAKRLRHALSEIFSKKNLLAHMVTQRNAAKDIGKKTDSLEMDRIDLHDIALAALSRAKESLRVLEELMKIIHKKDVSQLKNIRYNIYSLEKKFMKEWSSLFHHR